MPCPYSLLRHKISSMSLGNSPLSLEISFMSLGNQSTSLGI
ncbi:hypothetical protein [Microseira wollei]|nr:hypothetical protein [Microseira wollei]